MSFVLRFAIAFALFVSGAQAAWRSVLQVSVNVAASYVGPLDAVPGAAVFWGLQAKTAAYATGLGKLANVCTALDAVCADVSSDANGNFNISAVGSLACNNTISICTVKTLYDQVGTACAGSTVCDATQATSANRPTLVVPGATNGCTNVAKPCLQFVAASSQCLFGANTYTQAQPFSFSVVGQRPTSGAINVTIGFNTNRFIGWSATANTTISKWTTTTPQPTATASDATFHSIQYIVSNTVGSTSVDGSTTAGVTGTQALANAPIVGSAASNCATTPLGGFLSQAIIYPSALSSQNITDLNANDHSNWGF